MTTEYQKATEGIRRAEAITGPEWKAYAMSVLASLCRDHALVDADMLKAAIDIEPASPHAFGGVWRAARAQGFIEELVHGHGCERFICCRVSEQEGCHGMLIRVYRSKLYDARPEQGELW